MYICMVGLIRGCVDSISIHYVSKVSEYKSSMRIYIYNRACRDDPSQRGG